MPFSIPDRSTSDVSLSRTSWLLIVACYAVVTVWVTWPQAVSWRDVPMHQDPYFSIWRLTWIAHQLPRDPLHLFDTNIFFPTRGTLAFSDAVLFQGLVASPLLWLGIPSVIVYNTLILGSFIVSGVAMFILARALTHSTLAAFVAGLIFSQLPYRIDHFVHMEILWGFWMPLAVWAFLRTVDTHRTKYGILTGAFVAAQALSGIYYAIFLVTILVVLTVLLAAFGAWRDLLKGAKAFAIGGVIAIVIVLPYMRPYVEGSRAVGTRSVEEMTHYSATLTNYLSTGGENWLYGSKLAPLGDHEKRLFPGFIALALALVGLWPLDRRKLLFALALAFAVDLSCGYNGFTFPIVSTLIPPYQGLRVTARAAILAFLFLSVLAAYGVARLQALPWLRTPRAAAGVAVLIAALVVVEYTNMDLAMQKLPRKTPALARFLAQDSARVIMHYPVPRPEALPGLDPWYSYLSTFHWKKLINGYSAFVPPGYIGFMEVMRRFPDDRSLDEIRHRKIDLLVIHRSGMPASHFSELMIALENRPDLTFAGAFADGNLGALVYRVRRDQAPNQDPDQKR